MSQTPAILYRSTLASATTNQPRKRYPLPQNSKIQLAAYAFDQEFEMILSNFPLAQKNTPSTALAVGGSPIFPGLTDINAILTKYTQPSPTLAGYGKYTASFAIVPASWDDFTTQGVTFPGFIQPVTTGKNRPSPTRNVTVRLHYDYFVIDPAGILSSAGVKDSGGTAIVTYADMGSIPILPKANWMNTLPIGTPEPQVITNDLVPAAGVTLVNTPYLPTYPTYEQYLQWIANAASDLPAGTPWTPTNPVAWDKLTSSSNIGSAGQYQFQDSALSIYEGNIIQRMSAFVIPQ